MSDSHSAILTFSGSQAGAVWAPYNVALLRPFTVSVTMTLTDVDPYQCGADGWNLVLQADPRRRSALGGAGGGVGMVGGECAGWCPPVTPFAGLLVKDGPMTHAWRGALSSSSRPFLFYGEDDFNLSTSVPLQVVLSYDPVERRLNASTNSGVHLSLDINLVAELGSTSAVVGLTAGTGSCSWRHTASNFTFAGSTTADDRGALDVGPFTHPPRLVSIAAGSASPYRGRAVYVLDAANSCVWAARLAPDNLSPATDFVRVAGSGEFSSGLACASDPARASSSCTLGDAWDSWGSPATSVVLLNPTSIALSGDGTRLFVAERGRIRVVEGLAPLGLVGDGSDVPTIRVFAGNGVPANTSRPAPRTPWYVCPLSPTHLAYDDASNTLCFMSAGWLMCSRGELVARIPFPVVGDGAVYDASPWPTSVGGLAFSPNSSSLRVSDTEGRRVLAVPASTIALALSSTLYGSSGPGMSWGLGGVDDLQVPVSVVRISAPAGSSALSFAELELFAMGGENNNVAALGAASMSTAGAGDGGEEEGGSSSDAVDEEGAFAAFASDVILPGCADLPDGADIANASLAIDNDVACTYVLARSAAPWWEVNLTTAFSAPTLTVLRLTPLPLGQSVGLGGANISFLNADREVVASLTLPASIAAGEGGAFTVDVRCLLRATPPEWWGECGGGGLPRAPTTRRRAPPVGTLPSTPMVPPGSAPAPARGSAAASPSRTATSARASRAEPGAA
jgi:hypothetical protein